MIRHVPTLALAAVLTGLPLLTACGADTTTSPPAAGTPTAAPAQPDSIIGKAVGEALTEARKEIAEGNISVSDGHDKPKAEITPKGDLLIAGKAVTITAQQRAMLLDYRQRVGEVALAGADIGMQGADLATKAVAESLKGVFTGNTDDIEKKIEAQAEGIKQAALKLCDRLPGMYDAQQNLARALPEFAPYATMDKKDVDDCRDDAVAHDDHGSHGNEAMEAAQRQ